MSDIVIENLTDAQARAKYDHDPVLIAYLEEQWEKHGAETLRAFAGIVADEPENKRIARSVYCGRPMYKTSAKGELAKFTFICGIWEHCPHCMERRASVFRDRAEEAAQQLGEDNLVFAFVDEKTARHLTRKADKGSYLRSPQADGTVFIIASREDPAFADLQSDITIDDVDWVQIAQTPEGKRYSGALGKIASETPAGDNDSEPEEVLEMKVKQVIFEAPEGMNRAELIHESWLDACAETMDFQPRFVVDELEYARNTRTDYFIRALKRRGAEILLTSYAREFVSFSAYQEWRSYKQNDVAMFQRIADAAGYELTELGISIYRIIFNGQPQAIIS